MCDCWVDSFVIVSEYMTGIGSIDEVECGLETCVFKLCNRLMMMAMLVAGHFQPVQECEGEFPRAEEAD